MNDDSKSRKDVLRDDYEPPQAIHLNDSDRAYGECGGGSTPNVGYRENGFEGICVTGKSASEGCYAGIG
jgi:hypothetical protein